MELHKIYKDLGAYCDKGEEHSYVDFYEGLFAPFKDKKIDLLEIGIEEGGSLLMWSKYFSRARIYGVDVSSTDFCEGLKREKNIVTTIGDATEEETFATLPKKFNIIIDDGSHYLEDQIKTFNILFPRLKGYGLYIIEDVQSDFEMEELKKLHDRHIGIDLRVKKQRFDDNLIIFLSV